MRLVFARLGMIVLLALSSCISKPVVGAKPGEVPSSQVSTVMATSPKSPLCLAWEEPTLVGQLDAMVPEASGLAVSRQFRRLYHINDSGDGGVFYISRKDGTQTRAVSVEGFKPFDVEEITLGPCSNGKTCLFIGDIGDNLKRRQTIEIVMIEERELFAKTVKPIQVLKLRYPDGAHNAEAFAVHPNGDLFIVTKEMTDDKVARAASVFRLPSGARTAVGKVPLTLEAWGQLDVPAIVGASGYEGLVTGMSMAPSGDRVLLLTYDKVLEIAWDLAKGPWPKSATLANNGQLSVINVRRLKQQEAISYDENGRDFLYDTERVKALGIGMGVAEMLFMRCK